MINRDALEAIRKFVNENAEFVKANQLKFSKTSEEIEFISKFVDEKHVANTEEILSGILKTINGKDMSSIGVCLSVLMAVMDRDSEKVNVPIKFSKIVDMGVGVYKRKLERTEKAFASTSDVPS